jgi:hypothetical protein
VRGGSSSYVYALSPTGGKVIGKPNMRGRQREPSLTFMSHTLAVAEQYVRLHEAHYQDVLDELDVQTEPHCWRPLGDGSGGILKPDLLVTARTPDEDLWAFVEVDRSTEHSAAIQRKLALYAAYRATGREQARLGGFPQILWLVPNNDRQRRLQGYLASVRRTAPGLHQAVLNDNFINYLTKGGDHA